MAKIAIIGAGYVGLTTGVCFAHLGHSICIADQDVSKLDKLEKGIIPFVEADLSLLFSEVLAKHRISFFSSNTMAIKDAEIVFLCLPTPQGLDGVADTSIAESVIKEISSHLLSGSVLVTKSTVPIGFANIVSEILNRDDIEIVSNPEFLREGTAVNDFLHPDRVIIGSDSQSASKRVADVYGSAAENVIFTDSISAETIKYVANSFLATKLSFVNSIATLCEKADANIQDVLRGICSDERIGTSFLKPGPGWGGSCFPKDTRALLSISLGLGFEFPILKAVIDSNESHIERTSERILKTGGKGSILKIGVLGATFKAGTDDLRESPAVKIMKKLTSLGHVVICFDPTIPKGRVIPDIPDVEFVSSIPDVFESTDVVSVLTEWPEFASINPAQLVGKMSGNTVVDSRSILESDLWSQHGFKLVLMGRK